MSELLPKHARDVELELGVPGGTAAVEVVVLLLPGGRDGGTVHRTERGGISEIWKLKSGICNRGIPDERRGNPRFEMADDRFKIPEISDKRLANEIAHLPGADKAKIWEPEPSIVYSWGGEGKKAA